MAKLTIEGFKIQAQSILDKINNMSNDEIQSFEDWINNSQNGLDYIYSERELLIHFENLISYKEEGFSPREFASQVL